MERTISIKIKTDVNPIFLRYEWNISREYRITQEGGIKEQKYNKEILLSVTEQELTSESKTQIHTLKNGIEGVIYISEIKIYLKGCKNSAEIFSGMYTLNEIANGKIHLDTDYTEAPHFKTTSGKTTTMEKSTKTCQISPAKRAFFSDKFTEEQYFKGEVSTIANDLFNKEKFENDLQARISRKTLPNQAGSSLCGPASFFFCLLKDRPDIYTQVAKELWKYGKTKIYNLLITPSYECLHMKTESLERRNPIGLDWLTLAALRDSANVVMKYDSVSDEIPGVSLPSSLTSWFNKIGSKQLEDSTSLFFNRADTVFSKLNEYHRNGKHVILFVSANVIQGESGRKSKDHWVVLDKDAINFSDTAKVNFNVFSWGDISEYPNSVLTMQDFYNGFYGGLVFEPIK